MINNADVQVTLNITSDPTANLTGEISVNITCLPGFYQEGPTDGSCNKTANMWFYGGTPSCRSENCFYVICDLVTTVTRVCLTNIW